MSDTNQEGCGGNCGGCGHHHAEPVSASFEATISSPNLFEVAADQLSTPLEGIFREQVKMINDSEEEGFTEEEADAMLHFFMMGALAAARILRDGVMVDLNGSRVQLGYPLSALEEETTNHLGMQSVDIDEDEEEPVLESTKQTLTDILNKKL